MLDCHFQCIHIIHIIYIYILYIAWFWVKPFFLNIKAYVFNNQPPMFDAERTPFFRGLRSLLGSLFFMVKSHFRQSNFSFFGGAEMKLIWMDGLLGVAGMINLIVSQWIIPENSLRLAPVRWNSPKNHPPVPAKKPLLSRLEAAFPWSPRLAAQKRWALSTCTWFTQKTWIMWTCFMHFLI